MDTSLTHLLRLSPPASTIFQSHELRRLWQTLASNMTPQEMDIIRKRIPVLEKELGELESAENPEDNDKESCIRDEITNIATLLLLSNGWELRA